MIEHVWSVLCERAITDSVRKTISLIDLLDHFSVHGPPPTEEVHGIIPSSFELVTLWRRSDDSPAEKSTARVSLTGPQGRELRTFTYDIDLTVNKRTRAQGHMPNLPMVGSGRYDFRVEIHRPTADRWETVARIPLDVILSETPPDEDS
jgi:hypothetical protein